MIALISDLHIASDEEPLAISLRTWLESLKSGDTVISLGDCFDLLVGFLPFTAGVHQKTISCLEATAARGVEMHFVEGNHDFHLKPLFQYVNIHPDGFGLKMGAKKHWFEHGDLADTTPSYQVLRAFFRSEWGQTQLKSLSVDELFRFRQKLSSQGEEVDLLPLCRDRAEDLFCQGFDTVWMGHTHIPDTWTQGKNVYQNVGQTFLVNALAPLKIDSHFQN